MYLQSYWWLAVLFGLTVMHFLGNILLAFGHTQSWGTKILWLIFSLWLSFPVLILYWIYAVERANRGGRHSAGYPEPDSN